jgi:hypothetical protein
MTKRHETIVSVTLATFKPNEILRPRDIGARRQGQTFQGGDSRPLGFQVSSTDAGCACQAMTKRGQLIRVAPGWYTRPSTPRHIIDAFLANMAKNKSAKPDGVFKRERDAWAAYRRMQTPATLRDLQAVVATANEKRRSRFVDPFS